MAKFETGQVVIVWSYASGHKMLASVIEAEPHGALVESGAVGRRRSKWVDYGQLSRRADGKPVTYAMIMDGVAALVTRWISPLVH